MRRNIIIQALLTVVVLPSGSCIGGGMAPYVGPAPITGDNSGGAIVIYAVYETPAKQDFYVQRISAPLEYNE